MIRYALACRQGHAFESWFQHSDAFDEQAKRGLIACPTCGSTDVEKALMAPRLAQSVTGSKQRVANDAEESAQKTPASGAKAPRRAR
jgi:hypothetical protein